jgi:hypothetical protein
MAMVAQLVERRVVVPNVAGSSPVLRPIYKNAKYLLGIFIYGLVNATKKR